MIPSARNQACGRWCGTDASAPAVGVGLALAGTAAYQVDMVRPSPVRFPSHTAPLVRGPFEPASGQTVTQAQATSEVAPIDRLELPARTTQDVAPAVPRDPSLKPIVDGMLARLDTSDLRIDGKSPRDLFETHILDNPKVTDDQIRAMTNLSDDQMSDSRRAKRRTLRRFPDVRESINHRFTVDLIAGITGLDPQKLSEAKPSLGLTGSAQWMLSPLWKSEVPEVQRFTAIHDATSVMQGAGIDGLNKAVWGQGSSAVSAVLNFPLGAQLRSWFGFGRD